MNLLTPLFRSNAVTNVPSQSHIPHPTPYPWPKVLWVGVKLVCRAVAAERIPLLATHVIFLKPNPEFWSDGLSIS